MATAAETQKQPVVLDESVSTRAVRVLGRTPLYFFLAFIGVLWLVPTIGLFFTSLIDPGRDRASRLVGDPVGAEPGHVPELPRHLRQRGNHDVDLDDALDCHRRDDPPDLRRVARRLRLRLARVPGPRLALPRRGGAPRRADPDGADPDLFPLQRPRALRHRPRADPLPHRVRAALRDLPAEEFLHRDT